MYSKYMWSLTWFPVLGCVWLRILLLAKCKSATELWLKVCTVFGQENLHHWQTWCFHHFKQGPNVFEKLLRRLVCHRPIEADTNYVDPFPGRRADTDTECDTDTDTWKKLARPKQLFWPDHTWHWYLILISLISLSYVDMLGYGEMIWWHCLTVLIN